MRIKNWLLKYRLAIVALFFASITSLSYFLSYMLRFEFSIPHQYWALLISTFPLLVLFRLYFAYKYGLFHGWWGYAGISDLIDIFKFSTLGTLVFVLSLFLSHKFQGIPRSILVIEWLGTIILIGGTRFFVRIIKESSINLKQGDLSGKKRILIIGAGDAGIMLMREIKNNIKLNCSLIGFIDDNEMKKGLKIHGVPVLGSQKDLAEICMYNQINEIIIAIPSATSTQLKEIVENSKKTGLIVKTTPPSSSLINGVVRFNELRELTIEDLLGRKPIKLDYSNIDKEIRNQIIMVTGAGGSIGSELVWQIARYSPKKIILYERGESELYDIELKIKKILPADVVIPVIGDILDEHKLNELMVKYRPRIIYHAAAYKHVPMMESHPLEAVENNLLGTKKLAMAAIRCQIEKFVFISTDKAVSPTSIMGATKRATELFLQALICYQTKFMTVRFGNVLDSRGSVVPIFKKQIAEGGPVTVTNPYIIRYFMTIPEAAQLVLQASVKGNGGELFLLDMGEPVKILDLAENLIKLAGLEPYKDIKIVFTGIRPGEKLYEELFSYWEKLIPTSHNKIIQLSSYNPTPDFTLNVINQLEDRLNAHDKEGVIAKLKEIVPCYKESYGQRLESLEGILEKNMEVNIKICGRDFKMKIQNWEKGEFISMLNTSPYLNLNEINDILIVTFFHPAKRKVYRFETKSLNHQNELESHLLKIIYPTSIEEREDLRKSPNRFEYSAVFLEERKAIDFIPCYPVN